MTGGQEYYDGLITQGYTPDQAHQFTQQHFPGFTATAPPVLPMAAFEVDQQVVTQIADTHGIDAGALADTGRHFDANQDFILQPSELETTAQAMTNTVEPLAPAMAAPVAAPAMAAPMAAPAMAAPGMAAPVAAPMGGMPMGVPMAAPGMATAVVMPNNGKSVLVSYLLWFFLGILGVHHLYMGRGVGVFILALISFQGLGLWWFIDLFMIPGSTNMQRGGQMVIVA